MEEGKLAGLDITEKLVYIARSKATRKKKEDQEQSLGSNFSEQMDINVLGQKVRLIIRLTHKGK